MNILHFTLSYAHGGRRAMIENLGGAQAKCGHRCALAVGGHDPGPASELFGVVHCLERRSLVDWRAARRLHALCRRERINIIHTHDAASMFLVTLLRIRYPFSTPPALMTFHRSTGSESKNWRDRLRNRLACAIAGPVVAVSEKQRQHSLTQNRINDYKIIAIPNGIDVDRFRPDTVARARAREELGVADDVVVLGACGHFAEEKGMDVVLQAFRLILDAIDERPLRLVILGDGDEDRRTYFERLASLCGGHARFLGYQTNPEYWFQAFDIFLHGPRQEAFGLVVTEAMAAAVPVVATQVGGIPEIIGNDASGRLVEPESPASLAEAAVRLIKSPSLRCQIGQQGRQLVCQRFTVQLQAQRYLRLYEMLRAGRTSFDARARAEILGDVSSQAGPYAPDPNNRELVSFESIGGTA